MSLGTPSPVRHKTVAPYRVMLVDDSAVVRSIIGRMLDTEPDIVIEARATNGQMALDLARSHHLDVIVLDVEMPIMDGLTALPKLLAAVPNARIIMASTLTRRNAEVTLRALSLGASECLAKPSSGSELRGADVFHQELVAKVKALGGAVRRATGEPLPSGIAPVRNDPVRSAKPAIPTFRDLPTIAPSAVAIASSTGGPQALQTVLSAIGPELEQPVFITQHMPKTFTTILAEHLGKISGLPCAEALDGEPVTRGRVYIAPGDFHMVVERNGTSTVVRLRQSPPENFCRPSADPMLKSLATIYGRRLLTVVLTGMGSDGLQGARQVIEAGGAVAAQDEATSVVWGMPGAVTNAGLCCKVLPLGEIGAWIKRIACGERR